MRYAHLFPALASGFVKKFEVSLDVADKQTSLLASETTDTSLSKYILSDLCTGDKVELEWRQIRVETDSASDDERYVIIEQVITLCKLDAKKEAALLEKWPEPQIMIRKPQGGEGGACG